jgi:ABC-type bacteriocin/lantibiotic exporter with double-glycine peptidase domain
LDEYENHLRQILPLHEFLTMVGIHLLLEVCALAIAADAANAGPESDVRCGAASLCVAARLCGVEVTVPRLHELLGDRAGASDVSLAEIKMAAETLGLTCQPVSLNSVAQVDRRAPLIVAVQRAQSSDPHFVVLYRGASGLVQVLDYPWQPRLMRPEDLERLWTGKGLYVQPAGASPIELSQASSTNVVVGVVGWLTAVLAGSFLYMSRTRKRAQNTRITDPN